MSTRTQVIKALSLPINDGIENIEGENIDSRIEMAWLTLSALKNIHANTVNENVVIIPKNSRNEGSCLSCATTSKFFLLLLVSKSGRK